MFVKIVTLSFYLITWVFQISIMVSYSDQTGHQGVFGFVNFSLTSSIYLVMDRVKSKSEFQVHQEISRKMS